MPTCWDSYRRQSTEFSSGRNRIKKTFHYYKRKQLEEIKYRDVVVILLRECAAESKPSRRIIAHQPLSVKRFIDIEILGTFQAQSFDPLGREVARFLMQIRNGSRVEAVRSGAGEATEAWWEKGRC